MKNKPNSPLKKFKEDGGKLADKEIKKIKLQLKTKKIFKEDELN